MTLITVIMPVYNVEQYLERSINSVINQTHSNWELILVNDGSTDSSGNVCEVYSEKNDKIRVFHQENQGSGIARKLALSKCRGKYVCFVDPDDFIKTNALSENVKILEEFYPDIIMNGYTEVRKKSKKIHSPVVEGMFYKNEFREKFSEIEKVGSRALWNKLYSYKFLTNNNIDFTSQRVGQDALFNYESYKKLNSIYINKETYYFYDTTRDGSAVKTFKQERFHYEMNITQAYENMLKSWGKSEKYKDNIDLAYWKITFAELLNINYKTSPYSTIKSKILRLKEIQSLSNIDGKITNLNTDITENKMYKISHFLYKNKLYKILMLLMQLYVKFRLTS